MVSNRFSSSCVVYSSRLIVLLNHLFEPCSSNMFVKHVRKGVREGVRECVRKGIRKGVRKGVRKCYQNGL